MHNRHITVKPDGKAEVICVALVQICRRRQKSECSQRRGGDEGGSNLTMNQAAPLYD